MAIPGLGFIGGLALRFPRTVKFLGRYGKYILIAVAIGGAWFAVVRYLDNRDEANRQAGFAVAEKQVQEALREANERARNTQHELDLMAQRVDFVTQLREAEVTTIIRPQVERVTREVVSNPVYRACTVTDGVFDATNDAAAAANAGISSAAPEVAR
jgi:hypothetical protein